MQIELTRPLTFRDTELNVIDLDLDNLTGNDIIQAENAMRRSSPDAPLWGTQHITQIAGMASHIPADALKGLNAKDFLAVNMAVMNFFGNAASSASQENS